MRKILSKILESCRNKVGKLSSSRIASFFILGGILTASAVFCAIEIVNAIIVWTQGKIYEVPSPHIIIFGMVLSHHLFLLGLKNANEKEPKKDEQ